MQSVLSFLHAHPALVWLVVTALVNLVFGAAEKWAATHPKFAAVLGVMESAGLNARGLLAALAKLMPAKSAAKVGSVVFVLLGLGAVCATSQTACTPAEQQQVAKIAPEAAACVFAVVADVTVAPDIAGTIAKCGVTASDIYALVSALLSKGDAGAPDGAVGAGKSDPHLVAWAQAAVEYDRAHK